jgi:hypothetical protein
VLFYLITTMAGSGSKQKKGSPIQAADHPLDLSG